MYGTETVSKVERRVLTLENRDEMVQMDAWNTNEGIEERMTSGI